MNDGSDSPRPGQISPVRVFASRVVANAKSRVGHAALLGVSTGTISTVLEVGKGDHQGLSLGWTFAIGALVAVALSASTPPLPRRDDPSPMSSHSASQTLYLN